MSNFYPSSNTPEINIKKLSDPLTAQGSFQASSTAIGECAFYGITIRTDGVNAVTFTLWDATTVSGGNQLTPSAIVVNGSDRMVSLDYEPALWARNGLFLEATCAGTFEALVSYDN